MDQNRVIVWVVDDFVKFVEVFLFRDLVGRNVEIIQSLNLFDRRTFFVDFCPAFGIVDFVLCHRSAQINDGFDVVFLPVDKNGKVSIDEARQTINDETLLQDVARGVKVISYREQKSGKERHVVRK